MRAENQTKTRVREDPSSCPETLTKNVVQEFHLSIKDVCPYPDKLSLGLVDPDPKP
jgi:hypothetical protein